MEDEVRRMRDEVGGVDSFSSPPVEEEDEGEYLGVDVLAADDRS